jgi:hypothetical protein
MNNNNDNIDFMEVFKILMLIIKIVVFIAMMIN